MFTQPQRLRRFAVHVLLVWLFALGTGVVNACVVQAQLQQPSTSAASSAVHDHQHMVAALDDEDAAATVHEHHQHGDQVDGTHPACERLCNSPSVAPQPEKQQSNLLSGFWLAPAPVPSFHFESSLDAGRVVPTEPVRWRKEIPVSIAFLRLAL